MMPEDIAEQDSPELQTEKPTLGRISRFFAFCAGADADLLATTRSETASFIGLGGTVLATATLSLISATFALSMSFNVAWWSILPISVVWALIIFNLDRWLLTSFRKLSNQFWTFLSLIPRLVLAALIGFVISEPMVLEIFNSEIEEELRDVAETTRQARLDAVATGPESVQIEQKRTEIAQLESRLGQVNDSEAIQLRNEIDEQRRLLEGLEGEVAVARTSLLEAQASLEEEVVDGCRDAGEGCNPGQGPIAREKEREVGLRAQELEALEVRQNPKIAETDLRIVELQERLDQRRDAISEKIEASDDALVDQANVLKQEIDDLELVMGGLQADINEGDTEFGMLARIEALDTLREGSLNVNRLYWLLTMLLISIDTIPIFGKWIMSFGRAKPYELLRQAQDHGLELEAKRIVEQHNIDRDLASKSAKYRASARSANETYRVNHQAAVVRGVRKAQLSEWEQDILPFGYDQVIVEELPDVDLTTDQADQPLLDDVEPGDVEPGVAVGNSSGDRRWRLRPAKTR